MIPVILAGHILHLVGSAAVIGAAKHLAGPFIGVAKDFALETLKGEFGAQALHRSVKVANRVFHFEKHPVLTMLSHYLTEEKLEAVGVAMATAGVAQSATKSFQLGSVKMTMWHQSAETSTNIEPPPKVQTKAPVADFPIPARLSYAGISVYD